MTQAGRVQGKVALVTGAARGLGKGIASRLAEQGARVFISDLDLSQAEVTAESIGAVGAFRHNVTVDEDWARVLDDVEAVAGGLDILINNAGIAQLPGPNSVADISPDTWRGINEVNGLGVLLGCQHALRAMRKRGGGAIINMSSIAALTPSPTIVAYGFSKAGVLHLTRSVAQEGAAHGIRCNAILPGLIRTDMVKGLETYHAQGTAPEAAEAVRDAFQASIPMGAFQTEEDIAWGALYLASDEARYVTGTHLVIDGGATL